MRDFYDKNTEEFGNEQKGFANEHYIEQTVQLIGTAKELGNTKTAEVIIKKATIISEEYNLNYDFTAQKPNN